MKFATLAGCLLLGLTLFVARDAAADKSVAPRKVEPAKSVIPVQVKHADLKGEGEGVQAKLVLPARLREAAGAKPAGKVGTNEAVAPTQRSIVAAIALSLAAVSVVFVVRGKKLNGTSKGAILGVAGLLVVIGAAQADIAVPGQKRVPRNAPISLLRQSQLQLPLVRR
jgi:hypothetical protein